jgi:hypothetical protein
MHNLLTFPTADKSLAAAPCDTVSLVVVQKANILLEDREMSFAFLFRVSLLVSPPARTLGTSRCESGIFASSPLAAMSNPGPPQACMIGIISTCWCRSAFAARGGTGTGTCWGKSGPGELAPDKSLGGLGLGGDGTRFWLESLESRSWSESSESNKPVIAKKK